MTLDYLKDVLLDLPKETNAISESILNQIDTMKKSISSRAFCGEFCSGSSDATWNGKSKDKKARNLIWERLSGYSYQENNNYL